MIRNKDITAICQLFKIVSANPIKCVRVSSAKAKGKAKNYPYWGTAIYEIRPSKEGHVTSVVIQGASSDRRSHRLAIQDAKGLEEKGYFSWSGIGRVNETAAKRIIERL
jgi:hypothetical protein